MSEDTSDAEEEILVYATLDDAVNVDEYRSIHVLGIDEGEPIIQMDDTFFTGKFVNALGTYMFFEEDLSPQSADPLLDRLPDKNLTYICKTRKLLDMKQAYVTAKEEQEIPNQAIEKDNNIEAISFRSIEEALAKFRDEFDLEESKLEQKQCTMVDSDTVSNTSNKKMKKPSKDFKTLEEVFLQINHDYVKIDKKEAKSNNVILRSVLDEILNKMRECDPLFDSMKPKLDYLGSYYDGLRVGHPTEFDINVILKLPINYRKIKLDCTNTQYDFTNVLMPSEFRRLCKTITTAKQGFTKTELWCDNAHRLSVKKFRSWMQSVVDSAFKLPVINDRRVLVVKNTCYELTAKLSGPANTITIHKPTNNIDVDLVPTFAFDLPKIPINCAVDFHREEFKNNSRYFIVPKPTQDEYLWSLTFPFQERACMRSRNNFKSAVKLIKLLRDTQRFDKLASYYIKTLFLWETKTHDDKFWRKSLSALVLYMLKNLGDQLAQKEIKNYWCHENNLLDKLKDETCRNWSNKLSYILSDIEQNKKQNPSIVLKYFTDQANHTSFRHKNNSNESLKNINKNS